MGIICYENKEKTICNFDKKRRRDKKPEEGGSIIINDKVSHDKVSYDKVSYGKEIIFEKPIFNNISSLKLKEFSNKMIIQGSQNDTNDYPYNDLKNLEQDELTKAFQKEMKNIVDRLNSLLKFNSIKDTVIDNIIIYESTITTIKNIIADTVKQYERDQSKFKFKNLRIMLVGRKGIGKTDLIYYIFESDENVKRTKIGDLEEYSSEKYPYLKFVEYKGIGFDKESKPDVIGANIESYIKNLQKKDYNDYIHCVWYCITESKFEGPEIAVLKKLKHSYRNDNSLPVIVVYTKTESLDMANQMEQHIKNQNIDTLFIKTLAKSFEMPNGKIKEAFGRKELLDSTLEKCTKSLQGELINLMVKNIVESIQKELIKKTKEKLQKIQEKMIDDFVNEFHQVLNDGELIDYIINIITNNLEIFYDSKITNKSFNLLNSSDFKKEVEDKISNYKSIIKQVIKPIVEEKAKKFLDDQAKIEIQKGNMGIENKRKLKEFEKTSEIFLKKNFYYISQRLMISYILDNIINQFFKDFSKKFEKKIINILNIKNKDNMDIKAMLEHIFLVKLKDFGDEWGIKIENVMIKEEFNFLPDKKAVECDEERQSNNKLITNSFNLNYEDNGNEIEEKNINNIFEENQKDWFPYERTREWKYIKDKLLMDKFLQSLDYQDSYFSKLTEDQIFASLKEDIRKDLIVFLNKTKSEFIQNIDKTYSKKRFPFDNKFIQEIIQKEDISSIYDKQIQNEIEIINHNFKEITIDCITILFIGRSGIGKSSLINALLKEFKAPTGVGFRVTLQNDIYEGDINLPFLRLIDTRGTELEEITLDKIVKNAKEVIDEMKKKAMVNNDYNKNVQCIYYCIKGNSLEESEIKAIEEIKKNDYSIPVIIVYTMGINKGEIDNMRNIVSKRLNLPFISIISEKMEEQESYGLNELLKLTLDESQKATKGIVFKEIKNKICNKVKQNLTKENANIKLNIGRDILNKFINFRKVLNERDLFECIYNYLEIGFLKYMSFEQKENMELKLESKKEFNNIKLINDYIRDFIEFYKSQTLRIVEPLLENGSLEFLDMQVKKEKKLSKSIEIENKNDKESFKNIINQFLNANFYYISQKYLIYRFISDFSEIFSEDLEKKMNDIVAANLEKNKSKKLIKNTFNKIFDSFRESIYQNAHNGILYGEKNNNEDASGINKSINNNFNGHVGIVNTRGNISKINKFGGTKSDLECPNPYPSLEKNF